MSVCPHASHFSQTSAGISRRSVRGARGFFSFRNQAMAVKMTPGRQNFKAVDRKGREDRQGSVKSFRLAYLDLCGQNVLLSEAQLSGAPTAFRRDSNQDPDRDPAGEHERAAVGEERERDAGDWHEVD